MKLKKIDFKKIDFKKMKTSFEDQIERLRDGGKPLVWTVILTFVVMVLVCLVVFFASVHGSEKVMVPSVVGKNLEEALLEMQAKELYPKIQLKYSDVPGDEGKILDQSPDAGAIVKAYRRITLTVSRGVVLDQIEDYVGRKIDDVRITIQTQFTGQKQLIILAEPVYKADPSEAGTILEQNPPAGTSIIDPVKVQLVVSSGENYENTKVPFVVNQNVDSVLKTMASTKIIFEFTSHVAAQDEITGTVSQEQQIDEEYVPNYTRVTADFAFPSKPVNDVVYGIYKAELADYPYAVPVRLDATDAEGNTTTVINFNHTGKLLTIPYAVKKGTVLTLYVVDKENSRLTVE